MELESRLVPAGGTWTPLANLAPNVNGTDTMFLLSNGTIMAQSGSNSFATTHWLQLTPNSQGSYVKGTWSSSAIASMGTDRLFYTADMLQNGNLFILGGEYSGPGLANNFSNTGQIYDTATNTWTTIRPYPQAQFGDDPSETLPDGNILLGDINTAQTFIYDPKTNTYSAGGTKLRNDQSDEETWVKLPDGSVLSYDVFSSQVGATAHAQRYFPATNKWVDAGTPPALLTSAATTDDELGPGLLLPNGLVFLIGANNLTALYNPKTNSWSAGPTLPANLGADDAPAAILPDGDVIFAVDTSQPNPPGYTPPTELFDYNFATNTATKLATPPALTAQLANEPAFNTRMVVLPSGQLLFSTGTDQLWVFTPNAGPQNAWRPTIKSVVDNQNGTYTLTGTLLNGISEGSNYGDDVENATNYPIVRITDVAGHVLYARTFNWSSTGVATGNTVMSTEFTLPAGMTPGPFSVVVIANGIPSLTSVTLPFDLTSSVKTYFPIRYIYNPVTELYSGELTILNTTSSTLKGSFQISFPNLPSGVTLANASGSKNGVPFIALSASIPPGATLHVTLSFRDPLGISLASFFEGYALEMLLV